MGKSFKQENNRSLRNYNKELLEGLCKKKIVRAITPKGRLEGKVIRPLKKEGIFFESSGKIHKIFIRSAKENGDYIEVEMREVPSIDYIHHPENKRTWGKIRV